MRLDQLVDVLAIEVTDGPRFNPSRRLLDSRDILTICSSLVMITEEENSRRSSWEKWPGEQSTSYLRLAHFSVKEYLISDRLRGTAVESYALDEITAHVAITETCVTYLSYFENSDKLDGVENLFRCLKFPLYDYAARNWPTHYQSIDDETCTRMDNFFLEFLESTNQCFTNWVNTVTAKRYNPKPDPAPPIYYISEHGITRLVSLLLQKGADQVLDGNLYYSAHTRQSGAAACDTNAATRLSLYRKAGINAPGGYYGSALQVAVSKGHWPIVQLLLNQGADVNAQGGNSGNALQIASQKEDLSLVQLLLDWGADVNAQGGYYGNALQAACSSERLEILRLLLERGANVNAQGGRYGSALQAACISGRLEIVRLLLERGANVNAQGGRYGSALQAACWIGRAEAVRLLLDHGADTNLNNKKTEHALWIAS